MSRSRASSRSSSLLKWIMVPRLLGAVGLGLSLGAACSAGGSHLGDGTTTGQGGDLFEDGGTGGNGFDWDAACLKASDQATEVPVSLMLMFDKSGSMLGPKWSQSTAALQTFFADQNSAGLRVGLSFFPDSTTGCDESCNVAACAVPKVEPGPLTNLSSPTDTQEQALFDAFVGVTPGGGTPMSTALQGALDWATTYLGSHPFEKAGVVLVTDGEPADCPPLDPPSIAAEAAAAYASHGVLTFAIGLEGAYESTIDDIALAGGTGVGLFIGADQAQQKLVDALNHIRGSTVACDFVVPSEVDGQPVNPDLVNVVYTPPGGDPVLVGQVAGEGACTPDKGGWYYDNPDSPTRLTFCDSTCAAMQSELGAKVDILLGCTSVPA